MKILCMPKFSLRIPLEEGGMYALIAENQSVFLEILSFLYGGFPLKKEVFELSGFEKETHLDEVGEFVPSPFELNINSKANLNALSKILKKSFAEQLRLSTEQIKEAIGKAIEEIQLSFDVELTSDFDIKSDDVFKLAGIHFSEGSESLLQKYVTCCRVAKELRGTSIIFSVCLENYFSFSEIELLAKEMAYQGLVLVNVSRCQNDFSRFCEHTFVIDSDLCLIE